MASSGMQRRGRWRQPVQPCLLFMAGRESELAELEAKNAFARCAEDGSYTKEEFLERKQEIDNQVAAVRISMAECKIDQFDIEGALAYAIAFIRDLGRQWFDLRPELRPRFQKLIFPEGIPYTRNKGFGTAKLSVIFELNQQSHGSKYHTVDFVCVSWNQVLQELQIWSQIC